MIERIDAALDELRSHALVDGGRVRDILLDLRSEAVLLVQLVTLADDQGQAVTLPDLSD